MRFTVDPELELFAESVRAALDGWEAPLEPVFGEWQDDRDEALAARLAAAGWDDLGADPELLGAVVAGAVELGRAVAPLSLLDDATLGGPLQVGDRARHGDGRLEGTREPTLDGTGTLRGVATGEGPEPARLHAWALRPSRTLRASRLRRSTGRSRMHRAASSSAPRSRRSRQSRRGLRTPRSPATVSSSARGARPRRTRVFRPTSSRGPAPPAGR